MRAAVYRYWDAEGALLYIGASSCPIDRIAQHGWARESITDVVRVGIEWFDSRSDARRAEVAAIKAEHPRWNIASRIKMEAAA